MPHTEKNDLSLHPAYRVTIQPIAWLLLVLLVGLVASWGAPPIQAVKGIAGYPPLHTFLETIAIVIAMLVYGVCWTVYDKDRPGNMALLASVFLGVGLLDFLHALSIQGMPDFVTPGEPDKAIQFWLAARFLSALGFLAMAVRVWQPARQISVRWWYLAGVLLFVALTTWMVLLHSDKLPRTFIPGQGLTAFKIASEYALIAMFLGTAGIFLWRMRELQPYDVMGLFAATSVMAMSELFFTLYSDLADIFLVLGHVYKVIAFAFVYRSIFIDNVREPYQRLNAANVLLEQQIAERHRAEASQRQAMRDLAKAQGIAHLGSWRIDFASNALEWSDEALRIFGVEPNHPLTYDFFLSCVHPDDVHKVDADWRAAMVSHDFDLEYRIVAGGEIKWVRARAEMVLDEAGKAVAAVGSVQDITQRIQAIEALRESEERWKFALEGSGDGVWDWQVQTGELVLSRRWKAMLGHEEYEVGGTLEEWNKRIHPDDMQRMMAVLQDHIDGKAPYITELRLRCKDGSWKWVLDRGMVVSRDAEGRPLRMIGTITDISARKQMEDALRYANEDLEVRVAQRTAELEAAMMHAEAASEAKSQFLANMSHDIRTPMSSIIGMATLALRTDLEPKQRDYLSKIQLSAENLLGILNDILDISKIEAGKLGLEQVDFMLDSVFAHLASQLIEGATRQGLALSFDMDSALSRPVRGDPLRLRQVLTNYISNAIKFTEKGSIAVRARLVEDGVAGLLVRFEVQDTGIGIDADVRASLFQPFHQGDASTTRKYGGTGLGLAISKQLVELMGGEVGVESEPGRGSTFWCTVRFEAGNAESAVARASGSSQDAFITLRGVDILLVEDNQFNQQVAQELLEEAGAQVSIANNGEQALDMLRMQRFDCVLMDVQMPVMDGLEATRQIRADRTLASTLVIAMTANARGEDQASCRDVGMDDFVAKPIDPEALFTTLRRCLGAAPVARMPAFGASAKTGCAVDLSVLGRMWSNDPEKIRKYATMFLESARRDMSEIGAALAAGDLVQLGALGHRAKSSAATLGAQRLVDLCITLERCKRGGDLDLARAIVTQMQDAMEAVSIHIETLYRA